MPTGYTYPVQDGEITELKDFVLRCAHGFLAHMREDDLSSPIKHRKRSNHYSNKLAEARAELARLRKMTDKEKTLAAAEDFAAQVTAQVEVNEKTRIVQERYRAMLQKVYDWVPPTTRHKELKKFMIDQLERSLELDGHMMEEPEAQDPDEWYNSRVEKTLKNIGFYTENVEKEEERVRMTNQWIDELKEAL